MGNFVLNRGQSDVIEAFRRNRRNLFITGPGGTGKSRVLKEITKLADESRIATAVLAPTAVAARLIGGQTWHSYFGVGILKGGLTVSKNRALSDEIRVETLQSLRLLIIDEISFVREEELRLMSWILKCARGSNEPFGGVRILTFGDFFQLPPVQRPDERSSPHFAFQESRPHESNFFHTWHDAKFDTHFLTENLRSEDPEYSRLLKLLRDGHKLGEDELDILNIRRQSFNDVEKHSNDYLWIFPTNKECEAHNLENLRKLPGPEIVFRAKFTGRDEFREYSSIPLELALRKGAKVMMRRNDSDYEVLNGDLGIVQELDRDGVSVKFESGQSVELVRREFEILDRDYRVAAQIFQIPLSLAYAVTVHKAQGQTITDPVVIDLSRAWTPGHAYVALSRVKNREQILLRGNIKHDILHLRDKRVIDFYEGTYQPKNLPRMIKELHFKAERERLIRPSKTKVRPGKGQAG